ncbi:hypothetical protein [Streptomyces sp. NPDC059076]
MAAPSIDDLGLVVRGRISARWRFEGAVIAFQTPWATVFRPTFLVTS